MQERFCLFAKVTGGDDEVAIGDRTAWAAQPHPSRAKDVLDVHEHHLDPLSQLHLDGVLLGFGTVARNLLHVFGFFSGDVVLNSALGPVGTAPLGSLERYDCLLAKIVSIYTDVIGMVRANCVPKDRFPSRPWHRPTAQVFFQAPGSERSLNSWSGLL